MANETIANVSDMAVEDDIYWQTGYCAVGNDLFDTDGSNATKGAMRFTNITIDRYATVNMAKIIYKYRLVGSGSGSWKFTTFGIDEDNTSSFGYPFGRTKTSAYQSYDEGVPTSGGTKTMDVTSIVNEIVGRSGWNSGNAMGFLFEDSGSSEKVWASAEQSDSYLVYRVSAEPNFKPTPKSVTAPTIPAKQDYGMKISRAGKNVLTATEDDTFFTSGKNQFKVHTQGLFESTSVGYTTIAHNLGYIPFVMVYVKSTTFGTYWVRLPRLFSFEATPSYYVDDTNLVLYSSTSSDDFYYYIFLDQLQT